MLADVGVPMLAAVWPLMWFMLLPIVVLEAEWAYRTMNWSRFECYKVTSLGNLASSIVGIPIAWIAMFAIQFLFHLAFYNWEHWEFWWFLRVILFPVNVAWLPPGATNWQMVLAFCILSIPFCWTSIVVERKVARWLKPEAPQEKLNRWLRQANMASYFGLMMVAIIYVALCEG